MPTFLGDPKPVQTNFIRWFDIQARTLRRYNQNVTGVRQLLVITLEVNEANFAKRIRQRIFKGVVKPVLISPL